MSITNQENQIKDNSTANWKLNLFILWLSVFFCCASYTMCIPFLPVYLLKEMHVPQADVSYWSGLCFAVTFLGCAIMAPCWGALADHVGQRKMALRAGFGLALTYALTAISQDVYQLFAVRCLCGFLAGFVPACMSLASQFLPEHQMGFGMGIMQASLATGTIMGPMMGGYLAGWVGMRYSFAVGGVALLISSLLVLFFIKDLKYSGNFKFKELHLWNDLSEALSNKELRFVMFMIMSVQSCLMLIQPLITLYVGELMGGVDEAAIKMAGVVFSMAGVAGIVGAPFWGRRGQKHGFIKVFCFVTFMAGFVDLFQYFIQNVWQFVIIQFIFGLFLTGAVPNIQANLTRVTDKQSRGKAFGLLTAANQFGGVIGPLAGSLLGSFLATKYVLMVVGCFLMSNALNVYLRKVKVG